MDWHPLMIRLGKSVQELAQEAYEEILGHESDGGHKPARSDIQKMKDVYDLYERCHFEYEEPGEADDKEALVSARKEWADKFDLNSLERMMVHGYHALAAQHIKDPFTETLQMAIQPDGPMPGDEEQAKRILGTALKKYEQSRYAMLYRAIAYALADLRRQHPESYKLWPWAVKQMKEEFQQRLSAGNISEVGRGGLRFQHLVDIVGEGGALLNRLRAENRLPQNLDVNRLSFDEFEDWLMQWKRDNREAEAQGEVVYKYDDGWTMQKLTTPEQLQYEGDEMGHCVGGYAHVVGSGQDIIYSLRDPKGMPHVTMEVEALEGPRAIWDEDAGEEQPEDAEYNHEYIHPERDLPNAHYVDHRTESGAYAYRPSGETSFKVVQVMGNSNKTPKPEYQRKIREFLDYLRSKGWKFERSDSWFAPFDDPSQSEYGEGAPDTAQKLDEWYDDHYKTHHEAYRGIGDGDAYGLPSERATLGISDWEELFKDCFRSLLDDYDPGRWRGNWRDLAQAVYHAWFIDIYKDRLDPEALEKHRKNLVDDLQSAEETLNEWNDENWYYTEQHMQDEIAETIKEEAEKTGQLPKIEQALNEEYGEDMWDDSELIEWVRDNDEDLYYHGTDAARDKATDYFAGDAYKFCNYLIQLAEKNGGLNPQDLPNPNDRHGGLPSYEELQEMPWPSEETPVEKGLPGALSHTASEIEEWGEPTDIPKFREGEHVVFRGGQGDGEIIQVESWEGGWWYRVRKSDGNVVFAPEEACVLSDEPDGWTLSDLGIPPEGEDYYRTAANEYQIYPIDQEHNVWFDEDGNQHARYRPKWQQGDGDEWSQVGELEDTFLDKQGRQGQGWVAYHGDNPIGSLTYVADPAGWNMLGTTYVHPDYRQQGLFNRMVAPLREEGKPIDAYVWNNPWLKRKVRDWQFE